LQQIFDQVQAIDSMKGGTLAQGSCLTSANGQYNACLQTNGLFVLKTSAGSTIWQSTNTVAASYAPYEMRVSGVGFCIFGYPLEPCERYDPGYPNCPRRRAGTLIWCTAEKNPGPSTLKLEDSGQLVLYNLYKEKAWETPIPIPTGQFAASNTLNGQARGVLRQGQCLSAADGYVACMQADGNFVVYPPAIWASNTMGAGGSPYTLELKDNTNIGFCIHAAGAQTWCTPSATVGPVRLTLEPAGNLVLYGYDNAKVWQSKPPAGK